MGVVPALSRPEVGRIAALPTPNNLGSWLGFERNDSNIMLPNAQFGVNICDPAQQLGSWQLPYMALIFIWIHLYMLYILWTVTQRDLMSSLLLSLNDLE